MQEHCSEEIIIHRLKQYVTEFKDSIYKCEEQLEAYACHFALINSDLPYW